VSRAIDLVARATCYLAWAVMLFLLWAV